MAAWCDRESAREGRASDGLPPLTPWSPVETGARRPGRGVAVGRSGYEATMPDAPDPRVLAHGGAVLVLPPDPAAVGLARLFVHERCHDAALAEDACDTAVLLTSETVTNAFVHGRSEARVAVTAGGGRIRVEVGDDDCGHPRVAAADDDAVCGRGLAIVDLLAATWGVREDADGKVVWFEVRPHHEPA